MKSLITLSAYLLSLKWKAFTRDISRTRTALFSVLIIACMVLYAVGLAYLYDLSASGAAGISIGFLNKFFASLALVLPILLHLFPSVTSKKILLEQHLPLSPFMSFALDFLYHFFNRRMVILLLFYVLLFVISAQLDQLMLLQFLVFLFTGFVIDQLFRFSFFYDYGFRILALIIVGALAVASVYFTEFTGRALVFPWLGAAGSVIIYFLAFSKRTFRQAPSTTAAPYTRDLNMRTLLLRSFFRRRKVVFPLVVLLLLKSVMLAFLVLIKIKGKPQDGLNVFVFLLFETPLPAFSYIMNNCWGYQPNLTRNLILSENSMHALWKYFLLLLAPFFLADLVFFGAASVLYGFPLLNAILFFINAYLFGSITGFTFSHTQAKPLEKNDSAWSMRQQTSIRANLVLVFFLSLLLWQINNTGVMALSFAVLLAAMFLFLKGPRSNISTEFITRFSG